MGELRRSRGFSGGGPCSPAEKRTIHVIRDEDGASHRGVVLQGGELSYPPIRDIESITDSGETEPTLDELANLSDKLRASAPSSLGGVRLRSGDYGVMVR